MCFCAYIFWCTNSVSKCLIILIYGNSIPVVPREKPHTDAAAWENPPYAPVLARWGISPWVRKNPWRRKWLPTTVFLPGEFHGQRSLVSYSPWGRKELDTTEKLTHTHMNLSHFYPHQQCSRVPAPSHFFFLNFWVCSGHLMVFTLNFPENHHQKKKKKRTFF